MNAERVELEAGTRLPRSLVRSSWPEKISLDAAIPSRLSASLRLEQASRLAFVNFYSSFECAIYLASIMVNSPHTKVASAIQLLACEKGPNR